MPAPEESYELDRDCPRCWNCDDMGDVTRADGEWLGICSCAAGDRLRAESEYRSWFPVPPRAARGEPLPQTLTPRMATALFHGLGISGTECSERYRTMLAVAPDDGDAEMRRLIEDNKQLLRAAGVQATK